MVIQIGRLLSIAANDRPVRCAVITSDDVPFSTDADIAEIRDKGAKALANGRSLRAKRMTGVDANEPFMQIEIFPSTTSDLKRSSPFESCGQSQRR
jgi:enoyl-CoA hydratase/carnithine racemase